MAAHTSLVAGRGHCGRAEDIERRPGADVKISDLRRRVIANTVDARRRRLDAELWRVIDRHGLARHQAAQEIAALVDGAMSDVVRDVIDALGEDLRVRRFR